MRIRPHRREDGFGQVVVIESEAQDDKACVRLAQRREILGYQFEVRLDVGLLVLALGGIDEAGGLWRRIGLDLNVARCGPIPVDRMPLHTT